MGVRGDFFCLSFLRSPKTQTALCLLHLSQGFAPEHFARIRRHRSQAWEIGILDGALAEVPEEEGREASGRGDPVIGAKVPGGLGGLSINVSEVDAHRPEIHRCVLFDGSAQSTNKN